MTRSIQTFAVAVCALFAAMSAAPSAMAREQQSFRLEYGDLNPNTTEGARALLGRVKFIARQACNFRNGPMPLIERRELRRCTAEVEADVVAQVNHPVVTALHNGGAPAIVIASR